MSVYIQRMYPASLPRVHGGEIAHRLSSKEFIAKQFELHKIGSVKQVDLVSKYTLDGHPFYNVRICFKEWFTTHESYSIQHIVFNGSRAKFQYHKDWYWLVTENEFQSYKPTIDLRLADHQASAPYL